MRFMSKAKDGGPKSTVTGYWLIEWKRLFSIALLRFSDGSRDEYHNHAFNSLNWLLSGRLIEHHHWDDYCVEHLPGLLPIGTHRDTFHRVESQGTSWVLSFRGPWNRYWTEYDPRTGEYTDLTHGRTVVK